MEVGTRLLKTQNGKRVKMVKLSFLLMVVEILESGKLIKMGKYRLYLPATVGKMIYCPALKGLITDGVGFEI
jgi:hypothetical protein